MATADGTIAGGTIADGAPRLRRTIGPFQMTLYALGSMLGSGIYALIGTAAGQLGTAVWLAFLVALVAALLTALSYGSLGARHPRAAGAAYVVQRAYRAPWLSFTVGLALAASCITSVATQSRVLAGNVLDYFGLDTVPVSALAVGVLLILAGLVFRGIREAMWTNIVCTLIEATGLVIVIVVGVSYWGSADLLATPPEAGSLALVVLQGAVITFFSFIGFEDAMNVAEEANDPRRTLPIGLIGAMVIAAVLYVAVAITAVSVVPPAELAAEPGPLVEVVERAAPVFPVEVFTLITLFAVLNTALVNFVTASRLLYGMSRQGLLPAALGRVHARTRTPHVAVLALVPVVVGLALVGSIAQLAAATVLLLLAVFAVVNGALVLLKRRAEERPGPFEVPLFVPVLGAAVCAVLIVVRVATGEAVAPLIAGGLIGVALLLYAVRRPEPVDLDRVDPLPD